MQKASSKAVQPAVWLLFWFASVRIGRTPASRMRIILDYDVSDNAWETTGSVIPQHSVIKQHIVVTSLKYTTSELFTVQTACCLGTA